jgi:ubiquinone/menaquinone biosynthesis C-methylase UbiE
MAEPGAGTGSYSIARLPGELERLALQSAVLAPETEHLLDRIDVGAGWHCLDLGCGPGGITAPLSARVGAEGSVVGLDYDPEFVAIAAEGAAANTRFIQGNAYATGLPDASFDLVHLRFLASTAGGPERLVAEARRLVRPGGFVAAQEADFGTLACFPPAPAWTTLLAAYRGCFPWTADDPEAHRMYRLMRGAGLEDVGYRPVVVGVRAGDPWADYLPATVDSLRPSILARGLLAAPELDAALAACRRHLADPDTIFTSYTVVQTWGRLPRAD